MIIKTDTVQTLVFIAIILETDTVQTLVFIAKS